MNKVRIAIGTDHRGFAHKTALIEQRSAIEWLDQGAYDDQPSDYPIYAAAVCHRMQEKEAEYGVLLCGSGVGMVIAANRFSSIYAGLMWNEAVAIHAKQEDNCNLLVIPADYVSHHEMLKIFDAWMRTEFLGKDRYKRRLALIDTLV